jgi:hypothetical protein
MVRSTEGDYWRVSPKLLANFADVGEIKDRLQKLLSSGENEMQKRTRDLLRMLEAHRGFD